MTWSRTVDWDSDGWRELAACRTVDPVLFFPAGSSGDALTQIQNAKAVCQGCRARATCLQFALETNQEAGIWGGASEAERRTMRNVSRPGSHRAPVMA